MKKEISIQSSISNISIIENIIDEISIELSIVTELYGNILIAVIESVTNAIMHGNKSDESKLVKLVFTVEDNVLVVTVSDEGTGFNYDNLPDPTKADNVEKPDGRGVFLMRHLADEVLFERDGATVILKFYL
jgi:serine/threonine-protein kinase RsbW